MKIKLEAMNHEAYSLNQNNTKETMKLLAEIYVNILRGHLCVCNYTHTLKHSTMAEIIKIIFECSIAN